MSNTLDKLVTFRISDAAREKFYEECEKLNKNYTTVLRELVEAFNDDRLRVVNLETEKEFYTND